MQEPYVPSVADLNEVTSLAPQTHLLESSRKKEYEWLKHAISKLHNEELAEKEWISWSAYHAMKQPHEIRKITRIALLPLFTEHAHTPAMISHSMRVLKKITEYLNAGQTPVFTVDQPLYALAKKIQWEIGGELSEDKFVVLLAPFHTEDKSLKLPGQLLEGSGWLSVLVKAGVTTSGKAEAAEKGSHVTRTRYAHQVLATALYQLLIEAYDAYANVDVNEGISFEDFKKLKINKEPQFRFWMQVLELELDVFQYLRSIREGNFDLYIQMLGKLVHWFFSMGHTHYARWVPVHIRDMIMLKGRNPDVYNAFKKGKFVITKTLNPFSKMATDQAHEQENEKIKGDGGAVGLTEDPAALLRWMVAGPEVARAVAQFEAHRDASLSGKEHLHHEQTSSIQRAFHRDAKNTANVIREMGNPFAEDTG